MYNSKYWSIRYSLGNVRKTDKQSCIVPGCPSDRTKKRFIFPIEENNGLLWKTAVAAEELTDLSYNEIRKRKYCVCHLHFEERFIIKSALGKSTLVKSAIPTLRLDQIGEGLSEPQILIENHDSVRIDLPTPPVEYVDSPMRVDVDLPPNLYELEPMYSENFEENNPNLLPEETLQATKQCNSPPKKRFKPSHSTGT